jgi:hypothetical protein
LPPRRVRRVDRLAHGARGPVGGSERVRRPAGPPPPLDTQQVSISAEYEGQTFAPAARYFANRPGTNAWLAFVSNGDAVATENARLSFNAQTGETRGTGTLTLAGGVVLDLSAGLVPRPRHRCPVRPVRRGQAGVLRLGELRHRHRRRGLVRGLRADGAAGLTVGPGGPAVRGGLPGRPPPTARPPPAPR